jgi:hypothetical protein
MWTDTKMPYIWDGNPRIRLDVGPVLVNGTSSPCGKNREDSSTDYPQEQPFSHPIHILEMPRNPVHIWGYRFMSIFGQS